MIARFLKNRPISFYIILIIVVGLVLYTLSIFVYLKITGVYAVATITDGVSTSEGIDYQYEFYYLDEKYAGTFTDSRAHKIGSKFFVAFSKSRPSKNLLQYNNPVPDCLKDSIFSFWNQIPECSTIKTVK
jgi:hypothetical protein